MNIQTRPRPKLWLVIFTLLVVACVGLIVAFGLSQETRIDRATERADKADARAEKSDARFDDLLSSYRELTRDCDVAADCVTDAPSVAEVTNGAPGDRGPSGRDGRDGDMGLPGQAGQPGQDGTPGTPGRDGADGTNGTNGTDGAAGQPGAPGAQGPSGSDGQPPLSWTYTDAFGLSFTCTRTTPFDPAAPTYQCAPTPGEVP